ncbi:MAG: hypothetical protein ACREFF_01800 [Candidatus Udaeobacter sp.]
MSKIVASLAPKEERREFEQVKSNNFFAELKHNVCGVAVAYEKTSEWLHKCYEEQDYVC